jgi:hypothetical protein
MGKEIALVEKGVIHFKWKGGKRVTLTCTVENDEIIDHDPITIVGMGELESVTVSYRENEFPLCLECHNHLVKTRMTEYPEGSGNFEEFLECSNPNCSNKV